MSYLWQRVIYRLNYDFWIDNNFSTSSGLHYICLESGERCGDPDERYTEYVTVRRYDEVRSVTNDGARMTFASGSLLDCH